ncbi:MAG: DegT/DnrJ/EryC1/StrS family aminotransferase [Dictyoglomi bacterium]|nr:DegT/DnrJ/EryC1/StrS family aminotransferase [Dictyoglomota bacterium]
MKIPGFDLKRQYQMIKPEINGVIQSVLDGGQFILGENVSLLEEEIANYCGVKHAIGVASGTDALLLSLRACGIGPEDEVITTPFTFFATAEVISNLGAKPVFVDIEPETFNIDIEKIEKSITKKTRAIIPVHLFGQICDMDQIMNLKEKYNLFIIEDACQAIGAVYKDKKSGSMGNTGCFSFFPTKNLGGYGDGGMITTDNDELKEKLFLLRGHGSKKKYYHDELGYNSRLDELQAAILRVKLRYLDTWISRRQELANLYTSLLFDIPDVITPVVKGDRTHTFHQYVIRAKDRDSLQKYLSDSGIGSAIYYPLPLHLQKVYRYLGYKPGDFPQAEKASGEVLALPMWPELKNEEAEEVAGVIRKFYGKA